MDALFDYALQYGIEEHAETMPAVINLQVTPNPFSKLTTVSFSIEQSVECASGGIELNIYDATGRLVRDFSSAMPHAPYAMQISWEGDDNAGRKLPTGVYFVRLSTDESEVTQKVLLFR